MSLSFMSNLVALFSTELSSIWENILDSVNLESNGMATSTGYAGRGRLPALAVDVAIP